MDGRGWQIGVEGNGHKGDANEMQELWFEAGCAFLYSAKLTTSSKAIHAFAQ